MIILKININNTAQAGSTHLYHQWNVVGGTTKGFLFSAVYINDEKLGLIEICRVARSHSSSVALSHI